jgi:hypothetical protein
MNCKEMVYLLSDYLEGTMEESLSRELSLHLELCEPCMNFLRTYDKTRILCRLIKPEEIPEEVRQRLKTFVVRMAEEHHRDIGKYLERAARERRGQVEDLLRAYAANRLSPTMAVLFQSHRDRCAICGPILKILDGGNDRPEIEPDIVEHVAEFLDAVPPGEPPILP